MRNDGTVTVNVGDKIAVRAMGLTVRGDVLSACWWDEKSGWYIEIGNANVPGGYSYWKQGYDKGQIVELNGKVVEYNGR